MMWLMVAVLPTIRYAVRCVFASYWSAIITSLALDNMGAYQGRPSMGSVLRFIRKATAELNPTVTIGCGRQYRSATRQIAANALLTEDTVDGAGTVVHLAILAT